MLGLFKGQLDTWYSNINALTNTQEFNMLATSKRDSVYVQNNVATM